MNQGGPRRALGTVAPAGGPATQFHSSSNVTPSADDRLVTQSLQQAGEILGVRLIDYFIFSARGVHSFLDHGEL